MQGDNGVGRRREAEPAGRLEQGKRMEIKGKTWFGWNRKQDLPEGGSIKILRR